MKNKNFFKKAIDFLQILGYYENIKFDIKQKTNHAKKFMAEISKKKEIICQEITIQTRF